MSHNSASGIQNTFDIVQVSEPDDEDDDDLLMVTTPGGEDVDEEEDDEQYYRPFRHQSGSGNGSSSNNINSMNKKGGKSKSHQKNSKSKSNNSNTQQIMMEETKPLDLLAVLLSGPMHHQQQHGNDSNINDNDVGDIAALMGEAASKSQRARSMTNALASKRTNNDEKGGTSCEVDNDLYAATANAHTEAAISFQIVYRILLGLEGQGTTNTLSSSQPQPRLQQSSTLSPSEELARSMLILSSTHARMAKSLGTMGVKWNMMSKKDLTSDNGINVAAVNDVNAVDSADGTKKGNAQGGNKNTVTSSSTSNTCTSSTNNGNNINTPPEILQHERLRMAVRGALDTANHEEDITNSTFLARSTVLNANKQATVGTSSSKKKMIRSKNKVVGRGMHNRTGKNGDGGAGVNPVDDLMKLEKELRSMDMALEMESSVANLSAGGTASSSTRPGDGSFCVVPPGSSYMSSSSMWTSGILGAGGGGGGGGRPNNAQQQQGMAGVRSRANHLQRKPQHSPIKTTLAAVVPPQPSPQQQQGEQIMPGNAALDQSWWGGGQGSILASSAISTAAAATSSSSPQRPPPNNSNTVTTDKSSSSTNTKQLMQLMDSLNRLGNENAQLMREVEGARVARTEAKAAKDRMAMFKDEYSQRFIKVKEALKKYPAQHQSAAGAGVGASDNPVVNSAYMKSTSLQEIQKRDQMIKQLSTDLKKERDECKRKDGALQKYEAFYREVKARSAEKARQRQAQQLQEQQKQKKRQQLQHQ